MYCQNRIVHTIEQGDSLYRLARQYDTTVTELILGNPGVNPYNLQVGMKLQICPGPDYDGPLPNTPGVVIPILPGNPNRPGQSTPSMPGMPGPSTPSTPGMPGPSMPSMPGGNVQTPSEQENAVENLRNDMRMAWMNLIFWTRMYLMSVDADGKDQQEVGERALQAADEITDVFAKHLPIAATRQLRNLLARHMELIEELIRTQKSGNMENYDALIKDWYGNANQIAALIGEINPYFGGRETRNMLLNYLDMTRESIEQQLNGEYGLSIDTFRDLQNHVLEMADFFARGLLAR